MFNSRKKHFAIIIQLHLVTNRLEFVAYVIKKLGAKPLWEEKIE